MEDRINSFHDLNVWKKAHQLTLDIYKMTSAFIGQEYHPLNEQLKRSVTQVAINIAEGFQKRNRQEKVKDYNEAQLKLTEVHYLLMLTKDLGFADTQSMQDNMLEIQKMLGGLMRSVSGQQKST